MQASAKTGWERWQRDFACYLAPAPGKPLDGALRRAMERRFCRDLGRVRLHDGPRAQALAKAIGARAFTIGNEIFFAAGAFRPDDRDGRRLIAHELAHAVQQDLRRAPTGITGIGAPDDAYEAEAHRVAEAIETGARLPVLTPDRSGLVRRVVQFDLDSAGIDPAVGRAAPTVSLSDQPGQTEAAFHLGAGFNTMTLNPNDSPVGDPINFTGHVNVKSGASELATARFGFIQIVNVSPLFFVYQGRKPDEGHTVVDLGLSMGGDFLLDADHREANRGFLPFYRGSQANFNDGELAVGMRDHPFFRIPKVTRNFKTGFDNHLMLVSGGFDFFSTLVFEHPGKKLQALAHVHWQVVHDLRFTWRLGVIGEASKLSRFSIDTPEKGAPRIAGAAAKTLSGRLAPIGNDVFKAALAQVADRGSNNRFERDGAHKLTPANFFS